MVIVNGDRPGYVIMYFLFILRVKNRLGGFCIRNLVMKRPYNLSQFGKETTF